jgi:hypothetical protein
MEQLDDKVLGGLGKRVDEGKISREINTNILLEGNPTKERMYGRLEAYLQTGVVIDSLDLMEVVKKYQFSPEEIKNLALISLTGLKEGLVQEPDNMRHYGVRTDCFAMLSLKHLEATQNDGC